MSKVINQIQVDGELYDIKPPLTQTSGDDDQAIMSQKAVTDEFSKFFDITYTKNLYNKDDPDEESGLVDVYNGNVIAYAYAYVSGYIPIKVGKTYTSPVAAGDYGWKDTGYVPVYNSNKEFIGKVSGTIANGLIIFTINNSDACYIRMSVTQVATTYGYYRNNWMVVEGDVYPATYYPYHETIINLKSGIGVPAIPDIVQTTGDSEDSIMSQKAVTAEFNKFFDRIPPGNLYNKDAPDEEYGIVDVYNGTLISSQYFKTSGYIPVIVGTTYTSPVDTASYGWTDTGYVPVYNEQKVFIGKVAGSITNGLITFVITNEEARYIRMTIPIQSNSYGYYRGNWMVVEGDEYPSTYSPYAPAYLRLNADVQIPFPDIVQTTGDDPAAIMSQKAVTDEFNSLRVVEKKIINLFDNTDPDIIANSIIYGKNGTIEMIGIRITGYIPVKFGQVYSFISLPALYGWKDTGYVQTFDANKNALSTLTGTIDGNDIMRITISNENIKYIRTNVPNMINGVSGLASFMVVNSDNLPEYYLPYTGTNDTQITLNPDIVIPTNNEDAIKSPLYEKK